jgi:hypothetical protein
MDRAALTLLSAFLAATLLPGCLSDADGRDRGDDPWEGGAPQGAAAGSEASHGTPKRVDGPVDVEPEGGQFVARRTVTVTNDFGGAAASRLALATFNGGVDVLASGDGGYQFRADLFGRGATEQQARDALGLLTLDAADQLGGGRLSLSFTLRTGDLSALPLGLPPVTGGGVSNGGSFTLLVPPQPAHGVDARSSNAGIDVLDLRGPSVEAATTNGGISVAGAFGSLDLATINGGIDLDGTFHDVSAETSNAGIDANLVPTRTGRVDLRTQNAGIDVQVPESGAAYDVTGDTMNADVEISLDGTHIDSEDHATYRSPGFASAAVQVTITARTMNAGISVAD